MKKLFSLLLLSIIVTGCSSSGSKTEDLEFDAGFYSANIMDTAGTRLATGTFEISEVRENDISGNLKLNAVYVDNFSGSEALGGNFSGQIGVDKKTLWVKTNPMLADNNVFMNITAGKFSYMGEWRHSTMMGTMGEGKIQLFKMN